MKTLKFYSDTDLALFKSDLERAAPFTQMAVDERMLTAKFEGPVDPIVEDYAMLHQGDWQWARS